MFAGFLLPLLAAIALGGAVLSRAAELPPKLLALTQQKAQIALALTEPIARCVARKDTGHPAFRGCIDWHSAVHGTWALVAYTAMTGDRRYEPIIGGILSPANLAAEKKLVEAAPAFEMPYGRAWFLRLAIEHERFYHDRRLLPLADVLADSMVDHYRANAPQPLSFTYDNASWALVNLIDYYDFREERNKAAAVKTLVKTNFLAPGAACKPAIERPGFNSTCFNWAWLVSKVLSREEFADWLANFAPGGSLPSPVTDPQSAHEYGLNFSRAWGLWELYAATGNADYANAYADHFRSTFDTRSNWDGGYRTVGHWVGQFGMFAIQPLFGKQFR